MTDVMVLQTENINVIVEETSMETQQSLMEKLIAKAQAEVDFRKQLLTDPSSALKEAFDIKIPVDFKVEVHEDDARTAHIVLPASTELTDAQFEHAAGGSCVGQAIEDWFSL